jgi:hypothetical protein
MRERPLDKTEEKFLRNCPLEKNQRKTSVRLILLEIRTKRNFL